MQPEASTREVTQTLVRARGRVIRRDEQSTGDNRTGIGIIFDPLDPESETRLKALIIRASRGKE